MVSTALIELDLYLSLSQCLRNQIDDLLDGLADVLIGLRRLKLAILHDFGVKQVVCMKHDNLAVDNDYLRHVFQIVTLNLLLQSVSDFDVDS